MEKKWGVGANKGVKGSDFNYYWKKNPEAKRFYDRKLKLGDKKQAQKLLSTLRRKQLHYKGFPPTADIVDGVLISDSGYPKGWKSKAKVKKVFKNWRGVPYGFKIGPSFDKKVKIGRVWAGTGLIGGLTAGALYGYTRKLDKNKRRKYV